MNDSDAACSKGEESGRKPEQWANFIEPAVHTLMASFGPIEQNPAVSAPHPVPGAVFQKPFLKGAAQGIETVSGDGT